MITISTKNNNWQNCLSVSALAFMLCAFSFTANAGTANSIISADTTIYDYGDIDVRPEFPGGNDKIMMYIGRNFQYPAQARRKNIQGMILVQFIIAKTGDVTGVKVVRGNDLGGGLAEEAKRVVEAMPKWKPGKMKGEPANVAYTIPIVCKIPPKPKTAKSQEKATDENGIYNYASVEKKPEFPGGNGKIMPFIGQTFEYPAEARKKNIQGLVLVKFIIDENGKVTNVKAVRGQDLGGGLAEEAERVVKKMPQWTPAMQNGKAVKVAYTLPVVCRLQSTKGETTGRTIAVPEKE